MADEPEQAVLVVRGPGGKFAKGNPGGPGNPHAATVAKFRGALLDAVSEADVQAVMRKLFDLAMTGDVPAMKLFLERTVGRPASDTPGNQILIQNSVSGGGNRERTLAIAEKIKAQRLAEQQADE